MTKHSTNQSDTPSTQADDVTAFSGGALTSSTSANTGDTNQAAALSSPVDSADLSNSTDPTKGAALVGALDGAGGSLWTTVAGFIAGIISSAGSALMGFIPGGSGSVARTVQDKLRDVVHIKDYGAKCDAKVLSDGVILSGQNLLTSASAPFTSADVGKLIAVPRAAGSGSPLLATISAYNSPTQVTLSAFASATASGAAVVYGTDDTTAIQNALNAAAALAKTCIGDGVFCVSAKLVASCSADLGASTMYVFGNPTWAGEVSTGNATTPTSVLFWKSIRLPESTINVAKPATGWGGLNGGWRSVNSNSCEIHTGHIQGFSVGFLETAFGGQGNCYNRVHIGHLDNNQINHDMLPGDATSWVNDNNHFGGRFSHNSSEGVAAAGSRHIRHGSSTANVVNNNRHFGSAIEGNTPEYHWECSGSSNFMVACRWEATTPKVLYSAANTNQCVKNVIDGGYNVQNIAFTFTGTSAFTNELRDGQRHLLTGAGVAANDAMKKWMNNSSSSYPVLSVLEAGTAPESAGVSDWSFQYGAQSMSGKRKADSYARIKVDFVNGRIYFDNGTTSAPTNYIGAFGTNDFAVSNSWKPNADNTFSLGLASYRWSVVYAGSGSINTSDTRVKQQIRDLSTAERAVAVRLKALVRMFKFNDAVLEKGESARWHTGVIAQDVKAAFEAEGLVAEQYGVLCYDEWAARPAELDADGNEISPAVPSGDRYGVRYEELFAFIVTAL